MLCFGVQLNFISWHFLEFISLFKLLIPPGMFFPPNLCLECMKFGENLCRLVSGGRGTFVGVLGGKTGKVDRSHIAADTCMQC